MAGEVQHQFGEDVIAETIVVVVADEGADGRFGEVGQVRLG